MSPGLRERKKERTHRSLSETAITLFLERGYDAVSVAEIAEAAEVSKRTLFAYFPSKDALVLHRFADHEDDAARAVRERGSGQAPLDALQHYLRSALARRDPISGLSDHPAVVDFYRLIARTPALSAGLVGYQSRSEDALAAALVDSAPDPGPHAELTARLAACQILGTLRTLAHANQVRIAAGRSAEELSDTASREADRAFELLRSGLAPYRG